MKSGSAGAYYVLEFVKSKAASHDSGCRLPSSSSFSSISHCSGIPVAPGEMPKASKVSSNYCCGDYHACLNHHRSEVHQQQTTLSYPDFEPDFTVTVRRDRVTKQFHCLRCVAAYKDPRSLRRHARKSCLGYSSHLTEEDTNDVDIRASPYSGPILRSHEPPQPKIPNVTRTQRAQIRYYHSRGLWGPIEIVNYVGCEERGYVYAVRNDYGDNLANDPLYLEGKVGDIVNVDETKILAFPKVESTGVEVRSKHENNDDVRFRRAESEEEVESLETVLNQTPSHKIARSRTTSSLSSLTDFEEEISPEELDVEQEAQTSDQTPMTLQAKRERLSPSPQPIMSGSSSSTFNEPAHVPNPPRQPQPSPPSLTTQSEPEVQVCPVAAFLQSVKPLQPALLPILHEFGVVNGETLDALAAMPNLWAEAGDELKRLGMKSFEWLLIKNALEKRASC
ncbi:unnamed protein product [Somion occarium]|uniref:C2H2-type domain-containing protein n=1 Tax=Somion occarium TaxID=3059160 RepID=A0ABP1CIV1_9APHY